MNINKRASVVAAALPLVLLAAQTAEAASSLPKYNLVNLGTPTGASFATVSGITDHGVAGGYGFVPANNAFQAYQWIDGTARDLGTFGGPNAVLFGSKSGWAETAELHPLGTDLCGNGTLLICLPLEVRHGVAIALPVLKGGYSGFAIANNHDGIVVGGSENGYTDPSCLVNGQPVAPFYNVQDFVPVIWEDERARALDVFPGDAVGRANGVNDEGHAVGYSGDCLLQVDNHALIWRNKKPRDLGTLGGRFSSAAAINDADEVTGTSGLTGDSVSHAFVWREGVMQDIGTLPGDVSSSGNGINNRGQVVGQSCDAFGTCRAFFWDHGTMTDLNTLIPVAATSTLFLYSAQAINDEGEIGGYGYELNTGSLAAFLAVASRKGDDDSGTTMKTPLAARPAFAARSVVPQVQASSVNTAPFIAPAPSQR